MISTQQFPDATSVDARFMKRALDLATLGYGAVSPNPLVGCVIVSGRSAGAVDAQDGRVIGEGWHQKYGEAHAEVNAINDVLRRYGETDAAPLLAEATAYVTLEPCAHWGKTPPCAELLIRHRLRRVVVGNDDPNPLVAGRGIQTLIEADIEVETGVLREKGCWLNRRFFTAVEKNRPYIVLKWAQSADGFVARPDFGAVPISNALSQQLVHKWRGEEDAILVGTRTALHDNPRLNVRHWPGRDPVRVVIDRQRVLPSTLHVLDGSQPTLFYNLLENREAENLTFVQLDAAGDFLTQLVTDLHHRRIQSVLVEGGTATLEGFLNRNLWDEIRVFRSSDSLGAGIPAPRLAGQLLAREDILGDELLIFVRE
ncbi:MAG: bifunctional diaminohydroxyphosphoribosylaminopyrimidine deaminase/5-amino-6-(5-phosphoribosylamino)uracil reductase RibD [Cytophagaceae bacterium]|nr:bifunctional diaminohydroxyphosphoribosylaminopyrimidine deaminase/5-amino-6-(5-phosphoribosylamino)uracil reductase RibD [Cytophagaceae bacterium]